ncbi:Protein of unknown function [Pyronema omphalodes CBS 100304]|uniref:Uncharacterized protein n=1 Tax=Pyronema omphalodes (strain CBS 100304) TaxID=1076935 RepID=U4KUS6_PYROM|nr:Protein of unknown function [Pyronema omphalodes CBS 100304]
MSASSSAQRQFRAATLSPEPLAHLELLNLGKVSLGKKASMPLDYDVVTALARVETIGELVKQVPDTHRAHARGLIESTHKKMGQLLSLKSTVGALAEQKGSHPMCNCFHVPSLQFPQAASAGVKLVADTEVQRVTASCREELAKTLLTQYRSAANTLAKVLVGESLQKMAADSVAASTAAWRSALAGEDAMEVDTPMEPSEDPERAILDKYARRVIYSALLRAKSLAIISHDAAVASKKRKADLKKKADEESGGPFHH